MLINRTAPGRRPQITTSGFWFRPIPHECHDLHEFSPRWSKSSAREAMPLSCAANWTKPDVPHWTPNPEHRIVRRKNAKPDNIPAHLTEAARAWVLLDIDAWPMPPGACLRDDPVAVIEEAIHALLPEPFHDAECFWQLSSSAGFVPGVLKAHLCYWLSEAQDNAYLRAWFEHFAPYIDIAPFNAVQPHFVADPKIEGGDDPLPERTGWRHGEVSEVTLPPLPDVTDRSAPPNPYSRMPRRRVRLARREHRRRPGTAWRWRRIGGLPSASVGGIHAIRHPMP